MFIITQWHSYAYAHTMLLIWFKQIVYTHRYTHLIHIEHVLKLQTEHTHPCVLCVIVE